MITLTMNDLKYSLSIKKENNTYTVSLRTHNSVLQTIGLYKAEPAREFEIDFNSHPLQTRMFIPNLKHQKEIDDIKQYLKMRLESRLWTTIDVGGPEVRFNKLKLGSQLLELLYVETGEKLVEGLNSLYKEALNLEDSYYTHQSGKLGSLLVTLLCKYDDDFNQKYIKEIDARKKTLTQGFTPGYSMV